MLGQNIQRHMLVDDQRYGIAQRLQAVKIGRIGDHRVGQRLGLSTLRLMGLIEVRLHGRVTLEHQRIKYPRDLTRMLLHGRQCCGDYGFA